MYKSILFFALLVVLYSCNESSEHSANKEPQSSEENISEMDNASQFNAIGNSNQRSKEIKIEDRKLIWTADMEFQVKDVDKSSDKISALCDKYNAQISDMELNNLGDKIENQIVIRVPNEKFQKLVVALKGESIYMDRANVNSDDVTEEFVDIESRLKSKIEVRDRYIEILRNRTGTIEDVLNAEESIRVITEEIEAKEGRLRYLKNRVNYSTITLLIYHNVDQDEVVQAEEPTYSDKVGNSFSNGWHGVQLLILALVSIWPFILVITIVAIWNRKWIKKTIKSIRS